MKLTQGAMGREHAIVDLVATSFSTSEGEAEGKLVSNLVRDLLGDTPSQDLFVFTAAQAETLVGVICFSRMIYDRDERTVFILSPVAVAPDRQRQGIGTSLLKFGLNALRSAQIDVSMTYGDPNYYSKVGYRQISETTAQAPFKLTHPEGWLAQSLTGAELAPLQGCPRCVDALNDPVYW